MIYSSSRVCQQEISHQSPTLIFYSHVFFRLSPLSNLNVRLNYGLERSFNFANSICWKSIRWIEHARLASLQLKVSQIADWWLKLMTSNLQSVTSDLLEGWICFKRECVWRKKKWIDCFLCKSMRWRWRAKISCACIFHLLSHCHPSSLSLSSGAAI